ncbi:hypothetical protein BY996DRAFT_4652398 [Phakopsora pachyrhizi]|nr:hypothetical protein BY996DRAFT_4652398 [Phakopsora pachyrhizi]
MLIDSSRRNNCSSVQQIPTELWDYILELIPPTSLRSTALALSEVLPGSKVSIVHLFRHISISDDHQLRSLLTQLHYSTGSYNSTSTSTSRSLSCSTDPKINRDGIKSYGSDPRLDLSNITQTFSLRSWRLMDYNILINVLNLLSKNLRLIDLFIGPLFGPEQLEEMFFNPKLRLETLILRFNQNVSKRSYEPFLKGAYFDGCLDLLAKWPASTLFRSLSIVQDLPPPLQKSTLINEGIAQPIVLFRFWCITNLATSAIGLNIHNLRLRIPGRNLGPPLTEDFNNLQTIRIGSGLTEFRVPTRLFGNLRYLDISTSYLCSVNAGLLLILKIYPHLEHLVIDRTQLIVPSRFEGDEERVYETVRLIGTITASVGINRAVDTSRLWRDFHKTILAENQRIRSGRNGIQPPKEQMANQMTELKRRKAPKSGRSVYVSPRWKKDVRAPVQSTSRTTVDIKSEKMDRYFSAEELILPEKILIIPNPSRLVSLCCGTEIDEDGSERDIRATWMNQFERGWKDGMDRYKQTVLEKITEWDRTVDVWNKALEFKRDKLDEDRLESFLLTKPRLMKVGKGCEKMEEDVEDEELRLDGINLAEESFERFVRMFSLVDIDRQEVLKELDQQMMRPCPTFCTIPDCRSVGRVAWNPNQSDRGIDILKIDMKTPERVERLEERLERLKLSNGDTMDVDDEIDVRHEPSCGHKFGRILWS